MKAPKASDAILPIYLQALTHKLTHVARKDKDKHRCNECDFTTVSKTLLCSHRRNIHATIQLMLDFRVEDSVHKATVFYCELCDFTNNRKDYLRNHLNNAHGHLTLEQKKEILSRVKVTKKAV